MVFSTSFYFHFILSFVAYQFLAIFLCRGSWRNEIRQPLVIGLVLLIASHLQSPDSELISASAVAVVAIILSFAIGLKSPFFKLSQVRDGHNFLGILIGAALFAITSQLHAVLFGVPVFQLVR